MSAKIGVIGNIQSVSRKRLNGLLVLCLEVLAKPITDDHHNKLKRLDQEIDSQPIQYSVLLMEGVYNKFKKSVLKEIDDDDQLVGSTVNILGVPTLDLPMSVVEGDIGVLAFEIQLLKTNDPTLITLLSKKEVDTKSKIKTLNTEVGTLRQQINQLKREHHRRKTNFGATMRDMIKKLGYYRRSSFQHVHQYFEVTVNELQIPEYFTDPRPEKVFLAIEHYHTHGELPEIVVRNFKRKWLLVDGYAKFLAAQELGLEKVTVKNTVSFIKRLEETGDEGTPDHDGDIRTVEDSSDNPQRVETSV